MLHAALLQLLQALVACHRRLPLAVLVRFFVTYEKLAFLAVALRFILRYFNDREDAVAFPEDSIHLFQRAVCCLRIKEPDAREYGSITGPCA